MLFGSMFARNPAAVRHPDVELIAQVIAREPAACRAFVERLTPVIQSRVNAALVRRKRGSRTEVLDLTQEVFRALLDDGAKILRSWDPERGASLAGFVAIVAERRVASILVSGRKSGAREDPQDTEELQKSDPGPTPEMHTISHDLLERILDQLRARLSDRGYEMFHLFFVEEADVQTICARTGLARDAVYTWKARILRMVKVIAGELEPVEALGSDPATSPRSHKGGRG